MALEQDLQKLSILIVDDDLISLEMVEVMLTMMGVEDITRADSGSNAMGAIRERKQAFDCIICDCKMPNGNGLELLKLIRMGRILNIRPDSCFILLTAVGQTDVVKMAKQLDVSGYLVKPVSIDKLRVTIEKARAKYFSLDADRYGSVEIPYLL